MFNIIFFIEMLRLNMVPAWLKFVAKLEKYLIAVIGSISRNS